MPVRQSVRAAERQRLQAHKSRFRPVPANAILVAPRTVGARCVAPCIGPMPLGLEGAYRVRPGAFLTMVAKAARRGLECGAIQSDLRRVVHAFHYGLQ